MAKASKHLVQKSLVALGATLALSACNTVDRLSQIGEVPHMSPMAQVSQPVRMPMPTPIVETNAKNSLWRTGARAFFKDQRASRIGDIVRVNIEINDSANLENETERTRSNSEDANLTNLLGFETNLGRILPNGIDPASLAALGSSSSSSGEGSVERSESVDMSIAAVVSDVLPNGNMVIQGRQEVRINFEVRELLVAGVIRPEDISNENTVQHTDIAEARISYGGRGQITDVQQPRYGQQAYDILFPF